MPDLIPLIKKFRPDLPIVYRSHIEIRSDFVHVKGSPQSEVWQYLWNNTQLADLFISACPTNAGVPSGVTTIIPAGHPVSKFVPSDVPLENLARLGAAPDWYVILLNR
jgi:alpha,alpha-trehalose phosphorylase (configuration-retaining)